VNLKAFIAFILSLCTNTLVFAQGTDVIWHDSDPGPTAPYGQYVITPDGKYIVKAADQGGIIAIISVADGSNQFVQEKVGFGLSIAISSTSDLAAIGFESGQVVIYRIPSGAIVHQAQCPSGGVSSIAFRAGDSVVVAGQLNGSISEIAVFPGGKQHDIKIGTDEILPLTCAPTGNYCAFYAAGSLLIWDLSTETQYASLEVYNVPAAIQFTPDGRSLYILETSSNPLLEVYDLATKQTKVLYHPTFGGLDAQFSTDCKLIAVAGGGVDLYNTSDGSSAGSYSIIDGGAALVSMSASVLPICALGNDGVLYRITSVGYAFPIQTFGSSNIAMSNDGSVCAFYSEPNFIIRRVKTGEMLGVHNAYSLVVGMTLSPDGSLLAYSTRDTFIHIVDTRTWQLVGTLPGMRYVDSTQWAVANSLDWSNDGKYIVGVGIDTTLRIWDANSHELIRTVGPLFQPMNAVKVSPKSDLIGLSYEDEYWLYSITGDSICRVQPIGGGIPYIPFTADEKYILAGLWFFDVNADTLFFHTNVYNSSRYVSFIGDSYNFISAASPSNTPGIYRIFPEISLVRSLDGPQDSASNLIAVSGDGHYALTASWNEDGNETMWDISQFATVQRQPRSTSTFSIYPNPVEGNTKSLGLSVPTGGSSQLNVTDELGRIVHTSKRMLNAGLNPNAVEVGNLTPGIYFVQLLQNGRTLSTKLCIQQP
jgi:WD40 repeat protein